MNRLDRHIATVRSRLAAEQFLVALGYAVAIFFAMVLLAIFVDRFFWVRLPGAGVWFWAGVGAAVVCAVAFAITRRPSAHRAALFIDEKLGLNEKFSTALYARTTTGAKDPFATAAILDAERTADNLSLHRRFPIAFPVSGYLAMSAAVVVLLVGFFVPRVDLFGHQAKLAQARRMAAQQAAAQAAARAVLTQIQAMPAAVQNQQRVELAKKDLERALDQPNTDPVIVKDTAMKAQEDAQAARQEEIKDSQEFAQAQADKAVFNSLNPSTDDTGPVADASRDLASADFSKAADELQSLPDQFDAMTPEQQAKAIWQMKALGQQLQKIAGDPAAMQHLQQELQQIQKQSAQQTSPLKGPTQQQQQAMQKTRQQMQAVASSQAKARQMSSATQKMVLGMQVAHALRHAAGQPGQQQANAKQSGSRQSSSPGSQQSTGQQSSGQQSPGQQANGSESAGQQGQQPGGQQQMQQAGQQMAEALGQADAQQKDQQQQEEADNSGNSQGGNPSAPGQSGQGSGQGPGQLGPPDSQSKGGMGGPGIGQGGIAQRQEAPYSLRAEFDPSQNIAGGKILAKSFVKADQLIGKSTIELSPTERAAVKDSTDDVSEESVPKDAQKVVKDYFDTVGNGQ